MQQWLQDRQAEYARAAQLRLCRKCGAPILAGLDADMCALSVELDPTPITPAGEAIALMNGRGTFDLLTGKRRKEIWHRAQWNITAARRYPVLAAHVCGAPLIEYLDACRAAPAPVEDAGHEEAPF